MRLMGRHVSTSSACVVLCAGLPAIEDTTIGNLLFLIHVSFVRGSTTVDLARDYRGRVNLDPSLALEVLVHVMAVAEVVLLAIDINTAATSDHDLIEDGSAGSDIRRVLHYLLLETLSQL